MILLEKNERWRASIIIAEKIARTGDRPSAMDAAARAKRLRLDHMIWEER